MVMPRTRVQIAQLRRCRHRVVDPSSATAQFGPSHEAQAVGRSWWIVEASPTGHDPIAATHLPGRGHDHVRGSQAQHGRQQHAAPGHWQATRFAAMRTYPQHRRSERRGQFQWQDHCPRRHPRTQRQRPLQHRRRHHVRRQPGRSFDSPLPLHLSPRQGRRDQCAAATVRDREPLGELFCLLPRQAPVVGPVQMDTARSIDLPFPPCQQLTAVRQVLNIADGNRRRLGRVAPGRRAGRPGTGRKRHPHRQHPARGCRLTVPTTSRRKL